MHEQAVLKAAENAKAVIGVSSKKQLKVDPTKDLKEHYAELKKKAQPLPPGIVNYVNLEHLGFMFFVMFAILESEDGE